MYGEAFLLFPTLNSADLAVEVRGSLFPEIQKVVRPCFPYRFGRCDIAV